MNRKRVAGRFVREEAEESEPEEKPMKSAVVGAPRPRQCRNYARKRIAEAAPELVDVFMEKAKGGSVQHFKSLMELSGLTKAEVAPKVKQRRGKSLAGRLLEELREE